MLSVSYLIAPIRLIGHCHNTCQNPSFLLNVTLELHNLQHFWKYIACKESLEYKKIYTNFQNCWYEKDRKIHLNDEFNCPSKLQRFPSKKQNFPGIKRFPNSTFLSMPDSHYFWLWISKSTPYKSLILVWYTYTPLHQ